jgi:threonine dehydrogenase-like Zn-dependent dehydrogenase
MGRIGMVGMFWEPTEIEPGFWRKEAELLPAVGYYCKSPRRSFEEARNLLHRCPEIAQALITHRYPLEGFKEAFETASNRAAGAIKVVFEVGTG